MGELIGESIPRAVGISLDFKGHAILSKAQIPVRHRKSIDRTDDERSRAWWAKTEYICRKVGSGTLLALLGNRGTGKTQSAVAAMLHAAKAERSCLYTKAMEIFLDIRATYIRATDSRPVATELDALKKYLDPRLLVIDEIQQRGESDFENRILAFVIDKRYDAMSDTLLVGNLTPEKMTESLDPSIVDRLQETGGVVEFVWQSFRKAGDDDHGAEVGQSEGR